MGLVKFAEDSFKKFEGVWSAWSSLYPFKFFKGCLPQVLLGLFLNILFHIVFGIFFVNLQKFFTYKEVITENIVIFENSNQTFSNPTGKY